MVESNIYHGQTKLDSSPHMIMNPIKQGTYFARVRFFGRILFRFNSPNRHLLQLCCQKNPVLVSTKINVAWLVSTPDDDDGPACFLDAAKHSLCYHCWARHPRLPLPLSPKQGVYSVSTDCCASKVWFDSSPKRSTPSFTLPEISRAGEQMSTLDCGPYTIQVRSSDRCNSISSLTKVCVCHQWIDLLLYCYVNSTHKNDRFSKCLLKKPDTST